MVAETSLNSGRSPKKREMESIWSIGGYGYWVSNMLGYQAKNKIGRIEEENRS
jgi:hypothetical protein